MSIRGNRLYKEGYEVYHMTKKKINLAEKLVENSLLI